MSDEIETDTRTLARHRIDRDGRERAGDWMQTFSGEMFWPLDPKPEEVHIEDIAHALSLVCRYGGHAKFHYSVGQHSILASRMVDEDFALQALLHDAAEAYIGDMIRPVKRYITDFQGIEDAILRAVGERFGVELVDLPKEVKEADERMLATEVLYIRGKPPVPWTLKALPYHGVSIEKWVPLETETRFLRSFYALGGKSR